MTKMVLLAGIALLMLINGAMIPANAAHKRVARQQPVEQQLFGAGVPAEGIEPNSAAERAGMRPGDIIVGINGHPVSNYSDLDPFVARGGGRPITIHVRRGNSLVRLKAAPRHGVLGVSHTVFGFGFGTGSTETYIEPPPIPPPPPPDVQIPPQAN
jgi:membrane-associated protease RseP (regulator of RpoE activity)